MGFQAASLSLLSFIVTATLRSRDVVLS